MRKRSNSLSFKICYAYRRFSACIDHIGAAFFHLNHKIILTFSDEMSMKNGRGRGRMSKNRYPPFRPSEEIVDFWARLEPANFRATIENYVGNPAKEFKIKEARKLADLGKKNYFSARKL